MAKPPKKPKQEEVETEPDAWERFEKAMDKTVPPRPHKPPAKRTPPTLHGKRKKDA